MKAISVAILGLALLAGVADGQTARVQRVSARVVRGETVVTVRLRATGRRQGWAADLRVQAIIRQEDGQRVLVAGMMGCTLRRGEAIGVQMIAPVIGEMVAYRVTVKADGEDHELAEGDIRPHDATARLRLPHEVK